MFLLGFQPASASFLKALVSSTRMAEPELGSPVPPVQADQQLRFQGSATQPTNHPGIPVISDYHCFFWVCAVNNTNHIPDGRNLLLHEVVQGQSHPRGWPGAILCLEGTLPVRAVDSLRLKTVAVECLQQRLRCTVRDGQRGDFRSDERSIGTVYALMRGVSRCGRIAGVSREKQDGALLHGVRVSGRTICATSSLASRLDTM